MDEPTLLTPRDVDRLLRWPRGRALKAARRGTLPALVLPDGDVRFDMDELLRVLKSGHRQKAGIEAAQKALAISGRRVRPGRRCDSARGQRGLPSD